MIDYTEDTLVKKTTVECIEHQLDSESINAYNNEELLSKQPVAPDESYGGGLSVIIFVKLFALCEWFATEHKSTETSTRCYQSAAVFDECLNERNISRINIYVAMLTFRVTIRPQACFWR